MSDVPIRYSQKMRKFMLASQKVKDKVKLATMAWKVKGELLKPELPAIAEFSTNETMVRTSAGTHSTHTHAHVHAQGHSADRLASKFNVTREEQDQFALRSHINGARALQACTVPEEGEEDCWIVVLVVAVLVFEKESSAPSHARLRPDACKLVRWHARMQAFGCMREHVSDSLA
jgi:hypothetical protein